MIDEALRAEIRRLVLGEGWAPGTAARHLGVHRSVVERAVRGDKLGRQPRPPPSDVLGPYKPFITEQLQKYPLLTAVRLYRDVQDRGYQHGIAQVRRYVAQVRGPRQRKAYLSVHYEPGEQAQVDWGSFGQLRVGRCLRPLSAFIMVLSWSRAMFLDFALDQRMDTFCRMHARAFDFFEGVPRSILYDNLKSVVLHHVGSTVQFNPTFLGFAGHYLFEPKASPPYYPQAKGRVEGSVRYVRQSFFYGRSFRDLDDLRAQAAAWCDHVANARLHAATHERPSDRLRAERSHLRSLPTHRADTDLLVNAIVSKEARVTLDTNHYSVPPRFVGQAVVVRASDSLVRVLFGDSEIARHPRSWDRRSLSQDPAHLQAMTDHKPAAHGSRSRDRIASLSPEARAFLQQLARRRVSLSAEIDKLLRLLDRYGPDDLSRAITQALANRSFGASYVNNLLDQARFAAGLPELPEPIVTGNPAADAVTVDCHPLESYDALCPCPPPPHLQAQAPAASDPASPDPSPAVPLDPVPR